MTTELILLLVFAFAAGFVDAVAGGGGLIQLPAFFLAYPSLPAPVVLGSNKLASFAGTGIATIQYLRTTPVKWNAVWPAIFAALIFSVLGARLVTLFDKELMKPLVLVLLAIVAVYTFLKKDLGQSQRGRMERVAEMLAAFSTGMIIGFYDGFFGPGTGSFLILIYVSAFGFSFLDASVSAKLINCATNLAALVWFAVQGLIRYDIALPVALSNMTGSFLGARVAVAKGSRFIRVFFLVVVCGLMMKLGYDVLHPYF